MKLYSWITILYSTLIIASGLFRYISTNSANALWFGIVMGLMITIGIFFCNFKFIKTGLILHAIGLTFVGGYFIVKIANGLNNSLIEEPPYREASLVVCSLIVGLLNIKEWLRIKNPN
ncbi:MAG: hypothetical protein COA79_01910 [Planctomycetota bacterium]|nr:MAG: hypothetical protein COA79_01910 [Planctomycetota bacterium]